MESIPNIVIDACDIERVDHIKVLGVTVLSDLTWNMHIDTIVSKASKRVYMLYQLKRAGVKQEDLVRIYVSVIRPVVEYACPVWHSSLPQYLSDHVETVQKRSLKTIYPSYTDDEILLMTKLHTLVERRNDICKPVPEIIDSMGTHRLLIFNLLTCICIVWCLFSHVFTVFTL